MTDTNTKENDSCGKASGHLSTNVWQDKLLPLMSGLLLLLSAFFIVATFVQALQMQQHIKASATEIDPTVAETLRPNVVLGQSNELEYARMQTAALLEGHAIHRRYQQASLVLMSRVWIIYLGFVTGMILALVGASFILGKIREPVSQLGADSAAWKFSISSSSPGLILAVLGTVLMVTTMMIRADIDVDDAALYLLGQVNVNYSASKIDDSTPEDLPSAINVNNEAERERELAAKMIEDKERACRAKLALGKTCD